MILIVPCSWPCGQARGVLPQSRPVEFLWGDIAQLDSLNKKKSIETELIMLRTYGLLTCQKTGRKKVKEIITSAILNWDLLYFWYSDS